ncbi:hypothetical protein TVNIR_0609 [Thioalkalivibrio nitratireducens DSM 14787]|uniref:DUF2202 domain-containing protein n=1 Tax=Thioalkalivibrio nitratireducens (strain DSM 14787 / UNIQEM 213 / ALEN2) TaxID=1255043 RepID=L0DTI5_THIND|nr:hypothetical protein [Thioalkalivibrio nitratireducens]AGA32310.1 hypothetical protein TVNIR_0609 [Thioalkalivibrio nitratireducens DSM 14787]
MQPGAPTTFTPDQALSFALDDEYRARASYRAVLDAFGPVTPFVEIAAAEQRHIDALLPLFPRYGVAPPADRWAGRVAAPPTLAAACAAGVAGEIGNYSLYDHLLAQVGEPDVRAVFASLRNASAYRHLPAFQRCAGRAGLPVPGPAATGAASALLLGLAAGFGAVWLLRRGSA